jgi:hypothetical protein
MRPLASRADSESGLSIVKQLVELRGGTVRAQSPGPGQLDRAHRCGARRPQPVGRDRRHQSDRSRGTEGSTRRHSEFDPALPALERLV